jgi:hypothetical protein
VEKHRSNQRHIQTGMRGIRMPIDKSFANPYHPVFDVGTITRLTDYRSVPFYLAMTHYLA